MSSVRSGVGLVPAQPPLTLPSKWMSALASAQTLRWSAQGPVLAWWKTSPIVTRRPMRTTDTFPRSSGASDGAVMNCHRSTASSWGGWGGVGWGGVGSQGRLVSSAVVSERPHPQPGPPHLNRPHPPTPPHLEQQVYPRHVRVGQIPSQTKVKLQLPLRTAAHIPLHQQLQSTPNTFSVARSTVRPDERSHRCGGGCWLNPQQACQQLCSICVEGTFGGAGGVGRRVWGAG